MGKLSHKLFLVKWHMQPPHHYCIPVAYLTHTEKVRTCKVMSISDEPNNIW